MKITYSFLNTEWQEYPQLIENLVRAYNAQAICDVGGGANPVLPWEFVDNDRLACTVLDIAEEELEKAPKGYRKLVQDIEARDFQIISQFDFVITKMMAEHVRNGKLFHQNIFTMLKPGGVAVHYFPTLFALPFLINKVTPEWLSSFLLSVFLPRDRFRMGKFPAYYSWCYGPTPPMLRMLTGLGYEIVEYRGFFGNTYYRRLPLIRAFHQTYSRWLALHPNPYLTSFAQLILRKPQKMSAPR